MTLCDAIATPTGRIAVITFDDGYADNYTEALPILEKFDVPATLFVVTGDVGGENVVWSEAGEDLPADMLTWGMIRDLRDRGWEIGSHARQHIHLARRSADEQLDSIAISITDIEENLGETPVSFAYPYGSFDQRTKRALKTIGIKNAVTIRTPTFADTTETQDFLELSRLAVGGRSYRHYFRAALRTVRAAGTFNPRTLADHVFAAATKPESA